MPTSTQARDRSTPRTPEIRSRRVRDLVADPAHAAGAEVGEVLAEAGGVDPGRRGELTGGDGAPAAVGESGQHPQVDRQAGDGGLRDRPGPRLDHGLSTAVARDRSGRGRYGQMDAGVDSPAFATVTACERRNKVAGTRSALSGPNGPSCGGRHRARDALSRGPR